MAFLIDTHCHLYDRQFKNDLDNVIARAQENSIERILVPAEHIQSCQWIADIITQYKQFPIFGAAGVHPHSAKTYNDEQYSQFHEYLLQEDFLAVGEIGLDYYRNISEPVVQRKVFGTFLALSIEMQKPIIIHNRESTQDMLQIVKDWQASIPSGNRNEQFPGVFHGYNGDLDILKYALNNNFYVGIGGPLTFKNTVAFQNIVREIPLECIILETDSPYLSPHPLRGKRNEPANVHLVAEKLAVLKEIPIAEVFKQTSRNALELFGVAGVK